MHFTVYYIHITVVRTRETPRRHDNVAQSKELEGDRLQREARKTGAQVRTSNLDVQVRSVARGESVAKFVCRPFVSFFGLCAISVFEL